MNLAKAHFFDTQADAAWAAAPYGPDEQPKIRRLIAEARIGPGARVLEPGCGTGRLTAILADAVGPAGCVVALDISQKMVEACRARVADRTWVQVHQAAVEEYAIAPETFDAVVCHQVFPHVDDQAQTLTRRAGGLKLKGRLLLVHFVGAARVTAIHRGAGGPIQGDRLPTRRAMRRLCREAGVTVESLVDDHLGYLLCARRAQDASRS
jgi:cyclopropane fatty-acyl-phospholipid synthase-like methyltransferase